MTLSSRIANSAKPLAGIPLVSILMISASALAYEIVLMRVFSIIQWQHFAYMIISLALLGYGVSGTFLSLLQRVLVPRYATVYFVNSVLFSVFMLIGFAGAQSINFNPEELFWDWKSYFKLLVVYLCLALPFFFAANCIALSFIRFGESIAKIYAMDLVGAGVGSLGVVLLLFTAMPNDAVRYLALVGMAAALIAWFELRGGNKLWVWISVAAALLLAFIAGPWLQLKVSPYKSLPQTLNISGTRVLSQKSSPLGLISVVQSNEVPFRFAPGLSLLATQTPPPQLAVFTDADAMTVITNYSGKRETLAYMDFFTSALPYHFRSVRNVLVLGAGGGAEVLQAKFHDAEQIEAVELNPQMAKLMTGDFADYSGHLYATNNVRLRVAEARDVISRETQHYDVIQLAMLDSFGAAASGLYALNESYLYTVEAVTDMLKRLDSQGYLTITRWVKLPPKDTLKLFATAIEALRALGIADPREHLLLIRGWQTSTLVVKPMPLSAGEFAALRQFTQERAFDVVYYPGIQAAEVNRFNILLEPYFYLGAMALLGEDAQRFQDSYKFQIAPATDNQPYFFNFFKWRTLEELFALRSQGAMAMVEWGYILLVVTLLQVLPISVLLIVAPLKLLRSSQPKGGTPSLKLRVFLYFTAIGLAFLFLEMVFMQKFMLFLHHPVYAATAILAGFLLFSGLGSAWTSRLLTMLSGKRIVVYAVCGISVLSMLYITFLPAIFAALMPLPLYIKLPISIVLICPVAVLMGMPFPSALSALSVSHKMLIPWAWAINGCASVISAVLAALIAVQFGFTVVISLAVFFYIIAAVFFPGRALQHVRTEAIP